MRTYRLKRKSGVSLLEVMVSVFLIAVILISMARVLGGGRNLRVVLGQKMTAAFHAQTIVDDMKTREREVGTHEIFATHFPAGLIPNIKIWFGAATLPGEEIEVSYPLGDVVPLRTRLEVRWTSGNKTITEVLEVNL
ncbi:prepilin-type N-terminal cleavage/methylation domain-containing protein [Candidatus Omnitrophota bacterium]